MAIMDFIFGKNKNDDTCLLYSLMKIHILSQLQIKYKNFYILEQNEYYLDITNETK